MLLFSIQAFANMTMNVRQELCAVMVFAVVDKAGSTVMENEEEVCTVYIQEIDYEAEQEKSESNRNTANTKGRVACSPNVPCYTLIK